VQIVGERGGWLEILPPKDSFSLISGDYVESTDGQRGVVNGENVRVRAGSTLNDSKYTVQTMLPKGAEVTVLGRNPDGFLRIAPPEGATVWVSEGFVQRLSDGASAGPTLTDSSTDTPPDGTDLPIATEQGGDTASPTPPPPGERTTSGPFGDLENTEHRHELAALDAATQGELAKPVMQRQLQPLLDRYHAVAVQTEDELAQQYAAVRVKQIADMMALLDTVRGIRDLDVQAASTRRAALDGRARIPTVVLPVPSSIDARGVLRWSAVYPPDSTPRRVRLVETVAGGNERTTAYVEIPADLVVDLETMIGHFVGVRASAKRWQEGGVNPIPIYVAGELVLMDADRSAMNTPPGR
jgi:hypothetical protein